MSVRAGATEDEHEEEVDLRRPGGAPARRRASDPPDTTLEGIWR